MSISLVQHQPTRLPNALICAPQNHKISGPGTLKTAKTNASVVFPHPYPKLRYSAGANSGKQKAKMLRKN